MSNLTESMVRANQEYSKEKDKKKKIKEYLDKFAYDETSEEDQGLFDWIGTAVADTIFSPTDFTDEENQVFDEAIDSLVKVYKSVEARKGNKVTESKKRKRVKEASEPYFGSSKYEYDEDSEDDRMTYDIISEHLSAMFNDIGVDPQYVGQLSRFEKVMGDLIYLYKAYKDED